MRAPSNAFALHSAARIRFARLTLALTVLLAAGLLRCEAQAAQTTLRWDYSASGAAGFVLYCGASSRSYSTRVDVGNTDTYIIGTLPVGATSFCAVTAYDSGKVESDYSNELSVSIPSAAPVVDFSVSPDQRHRAADGDVRQRHQRASDELGVGLRRRYYQHGAESESRLQCGGQLQACSHRDRAGRHREQDRRHGDQRGRASRAGRQLQRESDQRHGTVERGVQQYDHWTGHELGLELRRRHHQYRQEPDPRVQHGGELTRSR